MQSSYSISDPSQASKLLIAIPCYKRPQLLERLLNSIAEAESGRDICVALFDDSPEGVNSCCQDYARKIGLNLAYHHNAIRLGIDANIDQCLSALGASYVWLMGEDDLIHPNGIRLVLDALQNSPNLVFANYSQASDSGHAQDSALRFSTSIETKQHYVDQLLIGFGFIGSVVVNSAACPKVNYLSLNTYFSHIGKLLHIVDASEISQLKYITDPCSINRVGSIDAFSWGGDAITVYIGFYRLLSSMERSFALASISLKASMARAREAFYPLHKVTRAIRFRSLGLLPYPEAQKIYKEYGGSPLSLFATLMPRRLALFLVKFALILLPNYRISS